MPDVYKRQAYLRENFPALEDNIIEDDFLKLNLEKLFDGKPFVLTGNYPYNIGASFFNMSTESLILLF